MTVPLPATYDTDDDARRSKLSVLKVIAGRTCTRTAMVLDAGAGELPPPPQPAEKTNNERMKKNLAEIFRIRTTPCP